MNITSDWLDAERKAWQPPEHLTVSEWADRYRVLAVGASSEPGPWRTDRTPYLRAMMDAMGDDEVQEVIIMKTPQVGGSEGARNGVAFWVDQDPAPCLIVFATEPTAKENLAERIIPMINETPRLRQYITDNTRDLKISTITLRSMQIYAGWAGAPASLATRPCRYVICDEVDKYPPFSGREADPVSLAEARQRTYGHRRKLILISTPTTKLGLIYQAFEGTAPAGRLVFQLPCPHCQRYQQLRWQRLRWGTGATPTAGGPVPDDEATRTAYATEVENHQVPVWYACEACEAMIQMPERHEMLLAGRWVNGLGEVYKRGTGQRRIAFHISSLYSPWVDWAQVVGKFLRSRSNHALMMDFMNAWLGEPFEEELNKVEASLFEEKANKGHPRGVVPSWARYVVASADVGARDAWYVIRAWGPNYRSRLLDWGHVHSLDELQRTVLNTTFQVEGDLRRAASVDLLVVDSGGTFDVLDEHASRTDAVYKFSLRDPRRIAVLKGTIKGERPVTPRRVTYRPPNGDSPYDVILNLVNVHYYKDVLSERLRATLNGEELWQACQGIDDVYCMHMTAEHRVLEREGRKAKMVWRPLSKGLPNHLWDCEVYQCAAADMIRVDLVPADVPTLGISPTKIGRTPTTLPSSTPRERSFIARKER
jgi:phage terminase large subunit GpA-like protein